MEKLISDYALTAVEIILACVLIGSFIAVYTTCNTAAGIYQKDADEREQQELYAKYAKYDEKVITDTEVLTLIARGVNLPKGIILYNSNTAGTAFLNLACNETVNIADTNVLSGLRDNIPAGTRWNSYLKVDSNNGEISYIEIRFINE